MDSWIEAPVLWDKFLHCYQLIKSVIILFLGKLLKSSEKPAAVTSAQEGINAVLYPFFAKHVF